MKAELTATAILQDARKILRNVEASGFTTAIRYAQIRLDMLTIGYDAVKRKIDAGHPYGTVGITLGTE